MARADLITSAESWLDFIEARNNSSHSYDEETAQKVFNQILLFRSDVQNQYHPHSDVDILFQRPDSTVLPAGLLSQIREDIEESRFPFVVDLVDREELVSSYRPSILATMVEV